MPVTFGSVQVIPASSAPAPAGASSTPAGGAGKQQIEARDLAPVLHQLHERAARLRAH
jgi:hypothetical protein